MCEAAEPIKLLLIFCFEWLKLKAATSKDLITIYTESSLWNDTLTALANFGKEHPKDKDFQSSWTALQKQLGLKNFSSNTWIVYTLPKM